MSAFNLQGRTALVTGGARGLGAAMAGRFAELGASLLLAGCSDAPPPGWMALDPERSGDCPVLTGSWSLAAISCPVNTSTMRKPRRIPSLTAPRR